MATTLQVYANQDDVLLFWAVAAPIAGCRGFAVARRETDPHGATSEVFLPNRTGFTTDAPPAPGAVTNAQPSTVWPFQRFSWTDHGATGGVAVSYQVIPMIRDSSGSLVQLSDQASAWSTPRTLQSPTDSRFAAYFNRGFVISQFMSHYLADKKLTPKEFKQDIQDADEQTIREFLSGQLRLALLSELSAATTGGEIYAALFELDDDELINGLCGLGGRAHIVLANGSISKQPDETSDQARQRDENGGARAKLITAGVDVGSHDRFTAPGPLAHNKFLVRTDAAGAPVVAWTGSTNWTATGLCTQLNNALLVQDPQIAAVYLAQWHRLRAAASGFPPELVSANDSPATPAAPSPGAAPATVWFSRTTGAVDLAALKSVVDSAKQGIVFLMFMPGSSGVLSYVHARVGEPGLYVRGVVSELPGGLGNESTANVNLVNGAQQQATTLDIVQPEGIEHPFANFAAEVTHQQFLSSIGYAIVHSKVLVIDPFSDNATVVTGSHNFSESASASNDENFIIIAGDRALAEAYTVNIMAAYDHYRWRTLLTTDQHPFNGLEDDDTWMAPKLASSADDLRFFGVEPAIASPQAGATR